MSDQEKHLKKRQIAECATDVNNWRKKNPVEWDHTISCQQCWGLCLDAANMIGEALSLARRARLARNKTHPKETHIA